MNGKKGRWAWLLWALPLIASADAIDVRVQPRALFGKGVPTLEVRILEPIAGFEVKLKRDDGTPLEVKGGGKPGVTRSIPLHQPEGKVRWEGEIVVHFPNGGEGSLPLKFDAELLGPLRMTLDKADVDLAARKITFKLSRPAARATVRAQMDTGVVVDREITFQGEPAGTPLTVEWPEASGTVMTLSLRAYDTSSFYTGVDLSPWKVDIPHEEVLFDSGKAEIRKDQQPKLDAGLKRIGEVIGKYGHLVPIRLFIVGRADTVGDPASNRALSLKRARSIGLYLRRRGLKIPILYEGLGEEGLAVSTTDEAPEQENRGARLILAVEEPVFESGLRPTWREL
jgi:outer membrane protein OmpA-like peptidoglycan-associated protein